MRHGDAATRIFVQIANETAVIVWDATTQTEQFIRTASFKTDNPDFGFLVPTPTVPKLTAAQPAGFDTLYDLATPKIVTTHPVRIAPWLYIMKMETSAGEKLRASSVTVDAEQDVAGLHATTVEASDPQALGGWLTPHGYAWQPALADWMRPYLTKHWKITAFKVVKHDPNDSFAATSLVKMTFHTDRPFFPYSEPATQRVPGRQYPARQFRIYVISHQRMAAALGPNREAVRWPGRTSYFAPLTAPLLSRLATEFVIDSKTLAANPCLTAFEDSSSPRPGIADLFFTPSADQSTVIPATIYKTGKPNYIPIEFFYPLIAITWIIWRQRQARRRESIV